MDDYAAFLARKRIRFDGRGVKPKSIGDHLFPFQREVVEWALRKGRAAIFADCGLGKTVMQLEWASHVPGRVLLLAPLAVSHQTEHEARRFGYAARARRDSTDIRDEKIVITNYEKLPRFDLSRFQGIVLDESSILKSYDGAYRNLIVESTRDLLFKLACTATPAPNDFMELGNHAEFLGAMTRAEMLAMFFCHDGGSTQSWRLKGHARREFWRWVRSWAVLFTKPSDLGHSDDGFDLPPLRFHRISVPDEFRDGSLIPGAVSLDLRQRRNARRSSLSKRCEAAAKLATDHAGPWLFWCDLNAESEELATLVPGAIEVRGSDAEEHKSRAMLEFADGKLDALVTKPRIAGFGMNWQACNKMAFVGLSDSYEALYQATRRCWRFGQTQPVDAYIVHGESESAVVENVLRKEAAHLEMQREMIAIAGGIE